MNLDADRRVFKLPTGYMHVDEHGISFTGSGTWTEAAMVNERGWGMHAVRMVSVVFGVAMTGAGLIFYTTLTLHLKGAMAFTIAVASAAWGTYTYITRLKDEMIRPFRIPYAKVRSMATAEGRLVVNFVNGAWKEDVARVQLNDPDSAWVKAAWQSQRRDL